MKHKYNEILPCPFCGNEQPKLVINIYNEAEKYYHIECECGAMMTKDGALFDNQKNCIKAWNRRKSIK